MKMGMVVYLTNSSEEKIHDLKMKIISSNGKNQVQLKN